MTVREQIISDINNEDRGLSQYRLGLLMQIISYLRADAIGQTLKNLKDGEVSLADYLATNSELNPVVIMANVEIDTFVCWLLEQDIDTYKHENEDGISNYLFYDYWVRAFADWDTKGRPSYKEINNEG